MWLLRYLESDNTFKEAPLRLIASDAIKVGRKDDADLVLKGDKAISRAHAIFTVEELPPDQISNIHSRQVIKVKDLGSKFGTKVRKSRLSLVLIFIIVPELCLVSCCCSLPPISIPFCQ
jgi:pSer/pThr/pTyr-binding forkhead associated (FHA) protein